jgi:phage terminase large subunit-like protein
MIPGWWTLPGAAPLNATRRDPTLATEGARVALVANMLGTPLLPWQRYTADVAGELLPNGTYRYKVVVVTVPRQSGKTTLVRAVTVDRALSRDGCGVFYTAQTGKDARERWADLVDAVKGSPLKSLATVRSAAGSERVLFPNGSMVRCFAPVATSLHGYTPPLVVLDEAFAHDEQTGNDLMGAIGPAQVTIPHRQLWIVSTAGTASSVFLRRWVDAGRAGTEGVALLEWAAGPDVTDTYDPSTWPAFHPAMVDTGNGPLVTAEAIAAQADQLTRAEFERAYLNRWTRTASNLIPAEDWDALANLEQELPADLPTSSVVYAYDVMPDRSTSALVAVWRAPGRPTQARVVRSSPGVAWLHGAIDQLREWGYRTFAAAEDGPAREVTDELARRGVDVETIGGRHYADAWGFLMRHIAEGTLEHDGSDALAVAAANVATRPLGDASAPSRRASAGDVTPLVALMVGAYVLERPPPADDLEVRFAI